jgi:hypothetical protein
MSLPSRSIPPVVVMGPPAAGVRWFGWWRLLALRARKRGPAAPCEDEHRLYGGGVEAAWPVMRDGADAAQHLPR